MVINFKKENTVLIAIFKLSLTALNLDCAGSMET